ncbi:uncharacterized protein TpnC41C isoform X1 [Drosophila kikkawai]|uniref:Uncharacterized protein TpnC41C isoform X1 n=3 Tax=melanogaster group TaxID=32346 RepID=A0ABM4G9T5_DROKI
MGATESEHTIERKATPENWHAPTGESEREADAPQCNEQRKITGAAENLAKPRGLIYFCGGDEIEETCERTTEFFSQRSQNGSVFFPSDGVIFFSCDQRVQKKCLLTVTIYTKCPNDREAASDVQRSLIFLDGQGGKFFWKRTARTWRKQQPPAGTCVCAEKRRRDELTKEQTALLRNAFNAFDPEKNGYINTAMVGTILSMLGHQLDDATLADIIAEVDEDGSGQIEFEEFTTLAARFLVEEDAEAMMAELKEAFRLYDKEGNGYITTGVLREILRELDDKLTNDDLDMMIEEIDSDGSGTVDFDEFMEVMTGGDD